MFGARAGNSLKAALAQIHMNLSSKCDDYSHDDESKLHRKTPRICGFHLWLLQQREEEEEYRISDWLSSKKVNVSSKTADLFKDLSSKHTEQVWVSVSSPWPFALGWFFFQNSSSCCSSSGSQEQEIKKEKESCVNEQLKESKTHSGRRLFLIDYSWLHKTKTL